MITKVTARGFKGCDFAQELSGRTIFFGPNGAGKSAHSQALQLAVNGGVIGAGKTNDDILSTFGEGDKLVVGVEIDGLHLFERGFVRLASGSVSQGYKVSGSKVSKEYFMKALGEAGAPAVLNVADFMSLSDQKKIEALFSLYPPAGDVGAVQEKIDTAKEKINTLAAKVKTSEQAAARIASSKSQIQVPAGTLAEVDAQIDMLEAELKEAQENLTQIRMEEQKAADALKAKEEADRKEKERIQAEEKAKAEKAAAKTTAITDEAVQKSLAERPGEMEKMVDALFRPVRTETPTGSTLTVTPKDLNPTPPVNSGLWKTEAVINSIQAIIDAMDSAGCESCAAKMIARRELRKYKGVVNHG
ncbi:MAG TPA: hypothetical protein DDZ40_07415 [Deltaproteobacteria bacterium]|nr:hypothetical protein [Deltaproteobacteria bacterium]